MAWFDGTFSTDKSELETEFPIVITENLRTDAEGKRIAIINDFPEESELGKLADPRIDEGVYGGKMFYHVFTGKDARKAKKAINEFVGRGYGKGEYEVSLYRKDEEKTYMYSYGELHTESPFPMWLINCHIGREKNYYVLPLKVYAFECPVCKMRSLQYRAMFDICIFCGWEDDGTENEDDEPLANGDYTIRTYREKYESDLKKYGEL